MKVWLAYSGEYDGRHVRGVFADRGSAVRSWAEGLTHSTPLFAQLYRDWADVEEFELQVAPPSERSP